MIREKYRLPIEALLHILLSVTTIYIIYALFPLMLSMYKIIFVVIILTILLLDLVILLTRKYEYLKITKIALIVITVFVFILFAVYYLTKIVILTDTYGMENILRAYESTAQIIFFIICFAQPIILPLPEAVTIPAGSAVFGPFTATYLGFLGTLAGIIVMFFLARFGGTKLVSKLIKKKHLSKYQEYVGKNETIILGLLFIIPILPDEIICVGAGIGAVSFKRFILIAALSKLITSSLLAYSVYLAQMFSLSSSQIVIAGSLILAVVFSLSFALKKYSTKTKFKKGLM